MASAVFNVLFKIIGHIVGLMTMPINLLIITIFPDFATIIYNFNNSVTTLVGGSLAWFSNLIPPISRATILLYLGIVLAYYTITINIHLLLKIIALLKNIKFW